MNSKLFEILIHYGILHQLKHFSSEVYELTEAIIQKEEASFNNYDGYKGTESLESMKFHIAEEIADCYVLLEQFRICYGISTHDLKNIINYKIDRQLSRIKKEDRK